jgi:hypothetical protein
MKFPDTLISVTFYADRLPLPPAPPAVAGQPVPPPPQPLSPQTHEDLIVQGITLVHLLSNYNPKWLVSCKPVLMCLLEVALPPLSFINHYS